MLHIAGLAGQQSNKFCSAGSAARRETVRELKQQEAELRRLLEDERKRCAVAEADRDEALDRGDELEDRSDFTHHSQSNLVMSTLAMTPLRSEVHLCRGQLPRC